MKQASVVILCILILFSFAGCQPKESGKTDKAAYIPEKVTPADDKYKTYYEIFVYSFCDSDGDGVGDINGIISKLDYIADMGFNGIWLTPIHKSSTYHKYDVIDYYSIDEQYGTLEDFDRLVEECDKRGIKLLLDLVLNHTSAQNEWFLQAAEALKNGDETNKYIDYYNFSKENSNGKYHPIANGWYYECPFWDQMPDLNLANEELQGDIKQIMKFWLDKGVYGFRLDAVKEYYSGNAKKSIGALEWIVSAAREINPDVYIVGENWDTTSAIYDYYKSGVDSLFNFPFAAADGKIAKTIINSQQTAQKYTAALKELYESSTKYNAIPANFLANHDTARAAGFMRSDENMIKLAWGMNLLAPGTAFVYYGEEIAMTGSGKDENKRAPMYWTADIRAEGMCYGPPAMDSFEPRFPPLDEQQKDENSILNYIKKAIYIRNAFPAIARGAVTETINFAEEDLSAVALEYKGEKLIVLYNLSKEPQTAELPQNCEVKAFLSPDNSSVSTDENTVSLSPCSIAVLG